MAVCPVFGGVGLIGGKASRPAGLLLLAAFAAAVVYLVRAPRDYAFLEPEEIMEAEEETCSYPAAIGLTVVGLVVIAVGGELVTIGAQGIVSVLGLSTLRSHMDSLRVADTQPWTRNALKEWEHYPALVRSYGSRACPCEKACRKEGSFDAPMQP